MAGWTDRQITALVEQWGEKSAALIGKDIGKPRCAVIGKAHRMGLKQLAPTRARKQRRNGWTDAEVKVLRRDYGAKSAQEIGQALGRKAANVRSKARDLGLSSPRRGRPTLVAKTEARALVKSGRRPNAQAAQTRHNMKRDGVTGGCGDITPGFQAPAPRACQWLYGEPTERDFCGAPAKPGSSYCDEHHARCYVAPALRQTSKSENPKKHGRLSLAIPT